MLKLPQSAQNVIDILNKAGFKAYAVGGSIRDLLMKRKTKGWDFTTNATPEEVLDIFPDSFYDNIFGTVGIKIYKNKQIRKTERNKDIKQDEEIKPDDIYEITTYRSEKGYGDRRHPDQITWGKTLEEDLARRDFSINSIAFDGKTVIDPYQGRNDLKNRIIRTVGNPDNRFSEDALRIMRAVRIASELGFMIEPETLEAIKKHTAYLKQISAERIRDELMKILASPFPADGILLLKSSGILKIIIPELEECFSVAQKSPQRHHIYDVGTHCLMALKHCPSDNPVIRLSTLLHDVGKARTVSKTPQGVITFYNHEVVSARVAKDIARRLRMSKKDTDLIYTLVRWHQFSVDERQTDSAIRRIIRHVGKENLDAMLALRTGDRLGGGARETSWRLELFKKRLEEVQIQPFSVSDLKINGYDVMKRLDIKPGPRVGKILNEIFALVETGKVANEKNVLLEKINDYR